MSGTHKKRKDEGKTSSAGNGNSNRGVKRSEGRETSVFKILNK